ncbi:hypothetical protein AB4K20DRAFT_1867712 [Rhizopus microsporus]
MNTAMRLFEIVLLCFVILSFQLASVKLTDSQRRSSIASIRSSMLSKPIASQASRIYVTYIVNSLDRVLFLLICSHEAETLFSSNTGLPIVITEKLPYLEVGARHSG